MFHELAVVEQNNINDQILIHVLCHCQCGEFAQLYCVADKFGACNLCVRFVHVRVAVLLMV